MIGSAADVMMSLHEILQSFATLTHRPIEFLVKNLDQSQAFREVLKALFDSARDGNGATRLSVIRELMVSDKFDDEQVWQQLELDNRPNIDVAIKDAASLLVQGELEFFGTGGNLSVSVASPTASGDENDEEESGIESDPEKFFKGSDDAKGRTSNDDVDQDELLADPLDLDEDDPDQSEESDDDEEDLEKDSAKKIPRGRLGGPASLVDDHFFKLSEMNEFLTEAEKDTGRDLGGFDFFAADDEDGEDEKDYTYGEFFDSPSNTDSTGTVSKDGGKSSFEKRQEKLKEKIKSLEEEAVFVKPWQLGGEISAMKRPENSLLEEFLQFDHVMRQPPVITEEVSRKLEDVILQRVKDKAWDDVERKAKPKNTDPYEFKKKLILDEAKSKKSLSQIYEQEYQEKRMKEDQQVEKEEHHKIRSAINQLFVKLDALSNFHFVPKPVAPDVKIINNLPTIVVEEVQPSSIATSQLLAPEEVYPKQKGESKGTTEASATDKKRARRKKKLRQKSKSLHQKIRGSQGKSKEKKSKQAKGKTGSSAAFFDKLQDAVNADVASKVADGKESRKRRPPADKAKNAKKFKL